MTLNPKKWILWSKVHQPAKKLKMRWKLLRLGVRLHVWKAECFYVHPGINKFEANLPKDSHRIFLKSASKPVKSEKPWKRVDVIIKCTFSQIIFFSGFGVIGIFFFGKQRLHECDAYIWQNCWLGIQFFPEKHAADLSKHPILKHLGTPSFCLSNLDVTLEIFAF